MNKEEMTRVVDEELKHIPKIYDDINQAMFRSTYNSSRRHGLKIGKTKEETLTFCVELAKKYNPTWQPRYESTFFKI